MAYQIYKSDGTPVTVPDNLIDNLFYDPAGGGGYGLNGTLQGGAGLGIQLIGRNTLNYGASMAQNLMQMTENFASTTVPLDKYSLQGQLWFKQSSTSSGDLYVRLTNNTSGGIANWAKLLIADPSGNITVSGTFVGSGAGLTNIPNTALDNSSITLGTTSVSLGSTATVLDGLTSITSTEFIGNSSTASKLAIAHTINGVPFDGSQDIVISVVASTLATPRDINGVPFDGSQNITITADTTNAVTFDAGGVGVPSGTTFNGSAPITVSFNSVGAPGVDGANAIGNWPISITGLAAKASTLSQNGGNGNAMTFSWNGQNGQPSWVWGSNDGTNVYVWNPSNFTVANANNATYATTAGTANELYNPYYPGQYGYSGYQKLPGGLIIQWGITPLSNDGTVLNIYFPVSFPNNCWVITDALYTETSTSGDKRDHGSFTMVNNQYFRYHSFWENLQVQQSWIAIGN